MQLSQACLTPWQIDLAALFSSKCVKTTTAENLSRLESFVSAYLLFDKVLVPEECRGSSFLQELDPEGSVFIPDARFSSPYKTNADGHTHVDIDPSLLFKNRRHLKQKSDAWLKQHMTLDLSKPEREEVIQYFKKQGRPASWFYQLILAEYAMQFSLAAANEAFMVVFGSLAQVYLPDIAELPQCAAFIERMSQPRGGTSPNGVLGTYSFELPRGGVEARVKMPSIFEAVARHTGDQSLIATLNQQRRHYESLRVHFRALARAFESYQGNELVSSDMMGADLNEWNRFVNQNWKASEEVLLLRSDIVAIEVHAGDTTNIFQTLRERVVAHGALLRLVPPQSHGQSSRKPNGLSALGIQSVVPFERKLFRIGRNYIVKRRALHRGLGLITNMPLSVGAQLAQEGLNDPRILDFGEEKQPHLYMICTRPRMTVSPQIRMHRDRIEMEFRFHQETCIERGFVPLERNNVRAVYVDDTHTQIVFHGANGEKATWRASLLYQSLVKSIAPESTAVLALDPHNAGLPEQQVKDLARADLEVIYIGQSQGRDFDRTAVARLNGHEKWESFYRAIAEQNSHREIWILLLSQSAPRNLNMTIPKVEGSDGDVKELIRRTLRPIQINPVDRLNFTEAALISYFKPELNDKFKGGAFPSKRHESYERFFLEPVDVASIELETLQSMGFRLYSKHVAPRAVHLKTWRFNPTFDVWNIFAAMDEYSA